MILAQVVYGPELVPRHKFVSPLAEPCSVVCDACFLQAVIYRKKIRGAKAIFAISDACFLQASLYSLAFCRVWLSDAGTGGLRTSSNLTSDAGTGGLRTGTCAKAEIRVAPGRAMFSSL